MLQTEDGAAGSGENRNFQTEEIRMIFAGDLLAQSIASSFGIGELDRPLYGLFGACSTMGEALSLSSMMVAGGYADPSAGSYLQSLCYGRKRIPLPAGLWKPETAFRQLDSDRQRSLCGAEKIGFGEDYRTYHWEDYGLSVERFPEYGSLYGSRSL